ncbi:hypothetical protein B0H66DRAFT_588712 [Apodospora peruviana]|uniref:Uncharacterized protein n=1 Tax=Apodospora peruviana TaxID=516989 RepID=A0AAE0MCJ4_9PEZI|nr:hypothetical protein B0H66DRAFT_588712 [Apodospora peruviana]
MARELASLLSDSSLTHPVFLRLSTMPMIIRGPSLVLPPPQWRRRTTWADAGDDVARSHMDLQHPMALVMNNSNKVSLATDTFHLHLLVLVKVSRIVSTSRYFSRHQVHPILQPISENVQPCMEIAIAEPLLVEDLAFDVESPGEKLENVVSISCLMACEAESPAPMPIEQARAAFMESLSPYCLDAENRMRREMDHKHHGESPSSSGFVYVQLTCTEVQVSRCRHRHIMQNGALKSGARRGDSSLVGSPLFAAGPAPSHVLQATFAQGQHGSIKSTPNPANNNQKYNDIYQIGLDLGQTLFLRPDASISRLTVGAVFNSNVPAGVPLYLHDADISSLNIDDLDEMIAIESSDAEASDSGTSGGNSRGSKITDEAIRFSIRDCASVTHFNNFSACRPSI